MLVELSVMPVGGGVRVSGAVATAVRIIAASGLPYAVGPMGTTLEGDWDEIMAVIRACRDAALKTAKRVVLTIKVDDAKGRPHRLPTRLTRVRRRAGVPLQRFARASGRS